MSFDELVLRTDIRADRDMLESYYDGSHRLSALGVSLPPNVRLLELIVNWPRLVVDSVAERMIPEGFRIAGSDRTDDRLWDWWQANNLDEESQLLHVESLVQGRGFIIVGAPDDLTGVPAITVHSEVGMAVRTDPLTRRVLEAVRRFRDDADRKCAAHYTGAYTDYYANLGGGWSRYQRVPNRSGVVPVIPMVNRSRIGDRQGRSEMYDVLGLTDAASRSLTSMQIAQELVAIPQRYVVGASAGDFVGVDGEVKTAWETYIGHMLTLENDDAKPGQFPGVDLRQFIEIINSYARQVSALSGLPAHFLGFTSENPASAEALRASESKLLMRVRQHQIVFGEAWERAMACALAHDSNEPADRLEIVWRDPSTPTEGAIMDAAIKGLQAGIYTLDQAREKTGMSAEQRKIAAESDHAGGFLPGATAAGAVTGVAGDVPASA